MNFIQLFGGINEEFIADAGNQWAKTKSLPRYRIHFKTALATAVILIGLSIVFHTEVKATWNNVTATIGRFLHIQEDLSPYTEVINKSISKDGVTVTFNEVILDKRNMYISYLIEQENGYIGPILYPDAWINGEKVISWEIYHPEIKTDGYNSTIREVMCGHFNEEFTVNDPVEVKIVLNSFSQDQDSSYEFHFEASRKELEESTIEVPLEQSFQINDKTEISLTEFRWNSIRSTIEGTCNDLSSDVFFYLKGEDNLGNPVQYSINNWTSQHITFVLDDAEKILSKDTKYLWLQLYMEDYRDLEDDSNGENTSNGKTDYIIPVGDRFMIQVND